MATRVLNRTRLALRRRLSWEAQLLIAVAALAATVVVVFRMTLPDVQRLEVAPAESFPDAASPHFEKLLGAYTGARFESGNRIEILLNGDGTYPRLWDDLRGATRSIVIQTYYAQPGAIADTLAAILAAQARRGVSVRLLLDGFGAAPLPDAWRARLRESGVRVATLRPLHWHSMHGAADRSHVRIVVVDGGIGYTGGFGIADYWSGDGRSNGAWRETNVRVEGPAVFQFQAVFGTGWHEATGELLTDMDHFSSSTAQARGSQLAAMLFTTTTTGTTAAERFLALMLAGARTRLWITNSYFVPNADYTRLLSDAARRGVDVRVLTAGTRSDVRTTLYAGRHRYAELLRAGVRIWEYQAAMMHAKTMSVDRMWSGIGSMNFDNRSLAFNDESTLLARDTSVAAELDSVFLNDLGHAREIRAAEWRARSPLSRLLERAANLLTALL
jgi:cardiolipin synthase